MPNEGGQFAIAFVRLFLNAVLLNQSIQDFTQIYGQTAIFDHFVRNRLFWSRTFTDRRPIFIDVSVILPNAAHDKSARQTISIVEGDYHACAKIGQICNRLHTVRFIDLRQIFSQSLFEAIVFLR